MARKFRTRGRGTSLLLLLTGALFLCAGCGADRSEESVTAQTETETETELLLSYPLTLKVGYSTGEDDPRGVALNQMKEEVEEATGGALRMEIYPDSQLGSDTEMISAIITGEVDMTVSSAGNYALYATRIGVSALPFLFETFDDAWAFIDSPITQELCTDLEEYNMHVLSWFDNGFRCVTTSEKIGPILSVEDMEGLNIRTPDNQIVMETLSELGANPRSYPFGTLKEALAEGIFDAQENSIPVIFNSQLYEEQRYLSITNHSYDAMPLTIRNDIWQALDPKYQEILLTAAKNAQDRNRSLMRKLSLDYVDLLRFRGMVINYPDLEPFKKATTGVMTVFSNVYGAQLLRYVQGLAEE